MAAASCAVISLAPANLRQVSPKPLARLIHLQVAARQGLFSATAEFLGERTQNPDRPVPFVIGVAGSVAVGKSTTARVLQVCGILPQCVCRCLCCPG